MKDVLSILLFFTSFSVLANDMKYDLSVYKVEVNEKSIVGTGIYDNNNNNIIPRGSVLIYNKEVRKEKNSADNEEKYYTSSFESKETKFTFNILLLKENQNLITLKDQNFKEEIVFKTQDGNNVIYTPTYYSHTFHYSFDLKRGNILRLDSYVYKEPQTQKTYKNIYILKIY